MQYYQLISLAALLGSIPFRNIAKLHRKRTGADTPARPMEPAYILAGIMDALKAFVPIYLAASGFGSGKLGIAIVWSVVVISILSDAFPYWLMFKPQGRSMAVALGAIFGLNPFAGAAVFVVWLFVLLISDKLPIAAITAAISAPVWLKVFKCPMDFLWIALAGFAYIMMAHSSAIAKLIDGSEPGWYRNNK